MSDEAPPEWLKDLPEPLRNAPFLGKAKDVDDAVGKLAHAAKLVGTSVRIPSEDASDDDRAAFYEKLAEVPGVAQLPTHDDTDGLRALLGKLGLPEDHTGYKLPELDGFEWDEAVGEDLRKYAHEAGLTTHQFNELAQRIGNQEKSAAELTAQETADLQKALRLDWGDTLEDREELIRGWMEKSNAPDNLRELLDERNLPLETMNWLHNIAKQFKGEVNPIKRDGTSETPPLTPAEAREQIPQVIGDMINMRESDPRYRGLQEKLLYLQRLANPEQAA